MKIILAAAIAVTMTTGALAQTVVPAAPVTEAMTPAPAATPAEPAAPAAEAATQVAAAGPTLVEKKGKWWNGDRRATKAEVAEYKQAQAAQSK
jgi:hypothetical protein